MNRITSIIKNIFTRLDERILNHGERVAYLTYELLVSENKYSEHEIKDAIVLALLHDVGALKTESIDNLITFDSYDTLNHCVYGYLFLKYFSPLSDKSKIILYHHTHESKLSKYLQGYEKDICGLIFLTDRIAVWNLTSHKPFFDNNGEYNQKYYQLFLKLNEDNRLINSINNGEYLNTIEKIDHLFKTNELKKYLEMIVYAIDFRSYQTVTHSLLVKIIAKEIAQLLNLSKTKIRYLTYSALIHDVGKVAIPLTILEKQGKLDAEEMDIMREHVVITKDIIKNNARAEIMLPAIRHHERSDGSGYPNKIDYHDLTIEDNIIIIADIAGALIMKRSYKESFSKEKTLSILDDLDLNHKIDHNIYQVFRNNYDNIIEHANSLIATQEKKFVNIKEEYQNIIKKES